MQAVPWCRAPQAWGFFSWHEGVLGHVCVAACGVLQQCLSCGSTAQPCCCGSLAGQIAAFAG